MELPKAKSHCPLGENLSILVTLIQVIPLTASEAMTLKFHDRRNGSDAVLPDGIFSDQKYFYGHLVYFSAKWYVLWPFDTLCGHLVYFSRFGILYREKSGNPVQMSDRLQLRREN
jgi:hypothetical protein